MRERTTHCLIAFVHSLVRTTISRKTYKGPPIKGDRKIKGLAPQNQTIQELFSPGFLSDEIMIIKNSLLFKPVLVKYFAS